MISNHDSTQQHSLEKNLDIVEQTIRKAGSLIKEVRRSGKIGMISKGGDDVYDPVTIADKKANAILCSQLHNAFPSYGLLSEEAVEEQYHPEALIRDGIEKAIEEWGSREYVWVIDPLDGTKEFVKGTNKYCVLVGLLKNRQPIAGLMHVPETNDIIRGYNGKEKGIFVNGKPYIRERDTDVIIRSPSENDFVISGENMVTGHSCFGINTMSVLFGNAKASCYTGKKVSLWDTCALNAIVTALGGKMTSMQGKPLYYTPENFKHSNGIIVTGNASHHDALVEKYMKSQGK